jgi:hypothetical protein
MIQSNAIKNKASIPVLLAQVPVYLLLLIFLALFLYSVSVRLPYPFEIDWIEGEIVCHGLRMAQGLPIYTVPATEFVSELYPPVYYGIMAFFYLLADTYGFLIPRLISVACFAGILVLLYRITVKEGGTKGTALLVSGFFLSFYEIHGPWYDLARVDMLLYFLVVLGCYVLTYAKRNTLGTICSAGILVLACYTKQTALYFLPCAALYLLFTNRKQCIIFCATVFLLLVSLFLGLQYLTEGWFGTYVLFNPLRYNQVLSKPLSDLQFQLLFKLRDKLLPEIRYEIFYKLPIFFTILLFFILQKVTAITRKTTFTVWEYTAVGAAIAYFSIRPHMGSERNDFIMMTLWGCLLLGLFLIKLHKSALTDTRNSIRVTAYVLLAVQLILQLYNPKLLVPAAQDIKKGYEFMSMVRNMPGEVYIPYHSYYAVMAGKKMIFNGGAYWIYNVLAKDKFTPADLIEKIRNKYFSAIIIDDKGYLTAKGERIVIDNVQLLLTSGDELSKVVAENYTLGRRIPYSTEDEFRNVTGFNTRPELILVPKKQ